MTETIAANSRNFLMILSKRVSRITESNVSYINTSNSDQGQAPPKTIGKRKPGAEPMSLKASSNNLDGKYVFNGVARVSYARKLKKITLQRYLCSVAVHRMKEISFEEILVLYDNMLWCQDKCQQDPSFLTKFGKDLSMLSIILKSLRFSSKNFSKTIPILSSKIKNELEHFLLPIRNLNGVQKHLKGKYQIRPHKEAGVLTKQLPQKAYIGVGYKDKGTARDPAHDGSPRWQDVAMNRRKPYEDHS